MNSKGEILKSVQAALFHAITMNGDQNHHKMFIKIIHLTNGKLQSLFILIISQKNMDLKQYDGE